MGQLNQMARYPIHFHLGGDQPGSYLNDNSVILSQFRCYVVHGTNYVKVMRNTAYNVKGNCYYIEDGVEYNNEFITNLAAFVNTIGSPSAGGSQTGQTFVSDATTLQPADHSAAGFYAANSQNAFIGNAASGGWAGFAFPNLYKPTGPSASNATVPSAYPLLQFEGNSAHSSGYQWTSDGSCIYFGGHIYEDAANGNKLTYNSGRDNSNPQHDVKINGQDSWNVLRNTRVWMCNIAINHWGRRLDIENFEMYDTIRGGSLFEQCSFRNAIFDANSGNPEPPPMGWPSVGMQFYDTNVNILLSNVTFKNYNNNRQYAVASMVHSDTYKHQGINAVWKSTFINTPMAFRVYHNMNPSAATGSARHFNVVDEDGSFTGTGVKTLIGSLADNLNQQWWRINNNCVTQSDWKSWQCPMGTAEVSSLDILVPGVSDQCSDDSSIANVAIGKVHLFGGSNVPSGERSITFTRNPGITGPVGVGGWYLHFNSGSPKTWTIRPQSVPLGRSIILALKYPAGTTFSVKYSWSSTDIPMAATYSEFLTQVGSNKYFFDGNHFYLKIYGDHPESRNKAVYKRGEAHLWSSWPYGGFTTITASCADPCTNTFSLPTQTGVAETSALIPTPGTDWPPQNRIAYDFPFGDVSVIGELPPPPSIPPPPPGTVPPPPTAPTPPSTPNPPVTPPVHPPSTAPVAWTYSSSQHLSTFNKLRKTYRLKNLVWDKNLAAGALTQAKKCSSKASSASARSADYAKRGGRGTVGETVAYSLGKTAVTAWNAEKKNWNCKTNKCAAGKPCKNYQQIVWGTTTRVGCYGATCKTGSPYGSQNGGAWNVLVCWFSVSKGSGRPFAKTKCPR